MTTGNTIALIRQTFVGKAMPLPFNMLSRLVMTFLPRSKSLLISWLKSPSAVILEPRKIKSFTVSPSTCYEVTGPDAMVFIFLMLSFKPTFSLPSFTFIKRFFSFSLLSAISMVSSAYLLLSLQSCPMLCDPKDSSPIGSTVPGILQARTLECVAISVPNASK